MSDTTTPALPNFSQWSGSPEWEAHLLKHHEGAVSGCIACEQRPLMHEIHGAVFGHGRDGDRAAEIAWSLQDGYGVVGMDVPQGWDWSGIRDSSPAAVRNIYDALVAEGLVTQ